MNARIVPQQFLFQQGTAIATAGATAGATASATAPPSGQRRSRITNRDLNHMAS